MQEHFGGVAMHWRTFIEQFVALPVQARGNKQRSVHVITAHRQQPARTEQRCRAVAEINRRGIRRGKQLLAFGLDEYPGTG